MDEAKHMLQDIGEENHLQAEENELSLSLSAIPERFGRE
jgi:hypothetical protein